MMTLSKKFICLATTLSLIAIGTYSHAQNLPDDVSDRIYERTQPGGLTPLERAQSEERRLKTRWRHNAFVSYGYSTNPLFSATDRKGDQYQTARYSLQFSKTLFKKNQITGALDISQDHYNQLKTLTSTLGHARLGIKHALTKQYVIGLGYDHSFTHFSDNKSATFNYHKIYSQLEHRVNKNLFHQLEYELGWKLYDNAKAKSHGQFSERADERKDIKESFGYSVGYTFNNKLSSKLSMKSSFNNSNSFFEDYYDYHTHEVGPRVFYKFTDSLSMNMNASFKYKDYASRSTAISDKTQFDRTYVAGTGFDYRFNDQHNVNFNYTYQENDSNDPFSHYTASQVEGGYEYNF